MSPSSSSSSSSSMFLGCFVFRFSLSVPKKFHPFQFRKYPYFIPSFSFSSSSSSSTLFPQYTHQGSLSQRNCYVVKVAQSATAT
ncbi:hypothetical protein MTR_0237s0010 [Medicago truncatula]|uniref:Uncharacterized protein n=1 Tax=Medicago truncatula TaxID=3880 RepID=A0A072TG15_MEDTR|nr:hypothetical protein MTR_0237s0010 [Medicago truncatula]